MNPQLQKQLLVGTVAAILIAGLTYFLLGGTRTDRDNLIAANEELQKKVDKGKALKANYEKLREEVAKQDKRIEELVRIMPTEQDTGELPYRIKKLADTAGIEQISFALKGSRKDQYYTEYMVEMEFRAGYHSFGQFASLVSGYDKIINLSQVDMTRRNEARSAYPAGVKCIVSAFVYNPEANPKPTGASAPKPAAPKADAGKEKD